MLWGEPGGGRFRVWGLLCGRRIAESGPGAGRRGTFGWGSGGKRVEESLEEVSAACCGVNLAADDLGVGCFVWGQIPEMGRTGARRYFRVGGGRKRVEESLEEVSAACCGVNLAVDGLGVGCLVRARIPEMGRGPGRRQVGTRRRILRLAHLHDSLCDTVLPDQTLLHPLFTDSRALHLAFMLTRNVPG